MADADFNEQDYLAANPDVASAVGTGLFRNGREHFEAFGRKEGRALNLFGKMSREDKALYAVNRKGLGLEIGPSHNPIAPKKRGFNVHILDHATAADLRSKYDGHGVNLDNIEEVDFVWTGQPLTALIGQTRCYDWIIASHVIEHVPDLISFLQQCEALLKADGVLSLVIPDKRYCFDHFSPPTSAGHLLDAWSEKRTRPSHGQVFDHFANASVRDGSIVWSPGGGGANALVHTLGEAREIWTLSRSASEYVDVHCWRFTPASFRLVLSDLQALGLTGLGIRAGFDTMGCEFYVSLAKACDPVSLNRFEELRRLRAEDG
jgi:SAM-dependent methyltransferase